jgi:hypothetical protein
VSVGAIATIFLLGFSPFAQQSATIGVRSINGTFFSTSATIGRSVQYVNDATNASFVEEFVKENEDWLSFDSIPIMCQCAVTYFSG